VTVLRLDAGRALRLEARFPGLRQSFDPDVTGPLLQQALIGDRGNHAIQECSPGKAYVDVDECLLRYAIRLRDAATGRERSVIVTGRLFADSDACVAFFEDRLQPMGAGAEGRREIAGFKSPVAVFESLRLAVYAFPIDPDLPTLIDATDPRGMTDTLGRLVPSSLDPELDVRDCRIAVAHYPRRHRCVLRYEVNGWRRGSDARLLVFGKVSSTDEPALDRAVIEQLGREMGDGAGSVRIPRHVGHVSNLDLVLIEGIPGTPEIAPLLKARGGGGGVNDSHSLDRAIDASGLVAAKLHRCRIRIDRQRDLREELAELEAELVALGRVIPEEMAPLDELLSAVSNAGRGVGDGQLQFSHGDFTPSQILFKGADVGLIDFDNLGEAEPELDLGQFCSYLSAAALKAELSTGDVDGLGPRLCRRFLETYAEASGISNSEEFQLRVRTYEQASLLRMAIRGWRQLKPARASLALQVLERIRKGASVAPGTEGKALPE
jgi:hypothetical protein